MWWNAAAAAARGGGRPGWLPPWSNGGDGTRRSGRRLGSLRGIDSGARTGHSRLGMAIGRNIAATLSRNPGHAISVTSGLALGASTLYYDQRPPPSRRYDGRSLTSGDPNRALTDALILWMLLELA